MPPTKKNDILSSKRDATNVVGIQPKPSFKENKKNPVKDASINIAPIKGIVEKPEDTELVKLIKKSQPNIRTTPKQPYELASGAAEYVPVESMLLPASLPLKATSSLGKAALFAAETLNPGFGIGNFLKKSTLKNIGDYEKGLKKLMPEKEYLIGKYSQNASKELKKAALAFSPSTTKALGKLDDSIAKRMLFDYKFGDYSSVKDFRKAIKKATLESERLKKINPTLDFGKLDGSQHWALKKPETLKQYADIQLMVDKSKDSQKSFMNYLGKEYNKKMDLINENEVFKNIANESPQYTDIIYSHLKNPKISDDEFVDNLVKQSNTFTRALRDPLEKSDLLTLKGKSITKGNKNTIDVEGFPVSDDYGKYRYKIEPNAERMAEISSTPINEKWSKRFSETFTGENKNVNLEQGWLSEQSPEYNNWWRKRLSRDRAVDNVPMIKYPEVETVPSKYIQYPQHQIFTSESKNQSLKGFDVSKINIENPYEYIPGFTRGYAQGGYIQNNEQTEYKYGGNMKLNKYNYGGYMYGNGGNTLYVNDPNHPRLKAYQDSLNVYNLSQQAEKLFKKDVNNPDIYNIMDKIKTKSNPVKVITPSGEFNWSKSWDENQRRLMEEPYLVSFAKPVQPVKYQKLDKIKTTDKLIDNTYNNFIDLITRPTEKVNTPKIFTDEYTSNYNNPNINKGRIKYGKGKTEEFAYGGYMNKHLYATGGTSILNQSNLGSVGTDFKVNNNPVLTTPELSYKPDNKSPFATESPMQTGGKGMLTDNLEIPETPKSNAFSGNYAGMATAAISGIGKTIADVKNAETENDKVQAGIEGGLNTTLDVVGTAIPIVGAVSTIGKTVSGITEATNPTVTYKGKSGKNYSYQSGKYGDTAAAWNAVGDPAGNFSNAIGSFAGTKENYGMNDFAMGVADLFVPFLSEGVRNKKAREAYYRDSTNVLDSGESSRNLTINSPEMNIGKYGGKMYSWGGNIYAMGGPINTMYAGGGSMYNMPTKGLTHEQHPWGGYPIGGNNYVEGGEVILDKPDGGKYIFSNRLSYK